MHTATCATCSTPLAGRRTVLVGETDSLERVLACSVACADIEARRRFDHPCASRVLRWRAVTRSSSRAA